MNLRAAWRALVGKTGKRDIVIPPELLALMGSQGAMMDWVMRSPTPDDEVRGNNPRLRARARDLQRFNSYVRHFLVLVAVNVVGPRGFRLSAQFKSSRDKMMEGVNDSIETGWQEWSERPVTLDGRMNLTTLSQLLVKSVARDGEAYVRIWRGYDGNEGGIGLEPIDPELIDEDFNRQASAAGNAVRMGVECDRFGRPLAYHVWNSLEYGPKRKRMVVPATDMIPLFLPDRVGQVRASSWLTTVMVNTKMLAGYTEAELVAARIGAAKMAMYVSKDGMGGDLTGSSGTSSETKSQKILMEMSPGQIGIAPPGYELQSIDPTHPTGAFPAFVKQILRDTATGLSVSYNGLGNDLEGVNFSSMRSGLLVERDVWKTLQRWWSATFLQRVYEEWLAEALLRNDLSIGTKDYRRYRSVQWIGRGWPWVDPKADVEAAIASIKNGLGSRTQFLAEQGDDFDDVLDQLATEKNLADEKGVEIVEAPKPAPGADPAADGTTGNGNGDTGGRSNGVAKNLTYGLNGDRLPVSVLEGGN